MSPRAVGGALGLLALGLLAWAGAREPAAPVTAAGDRPLGGPAAPGEPSAPAPARDAEPQPPARPEATLSGEVPTRGAELASAGRDATLTLQLLVRREAVSVVRSELRARPWRPGPEEPGDRFEVEVRGADGQVDVQTFAVKSLLPERLQAAAGAGPLGVGDELYLTEVPWLLTLPAPSLPAELSFRNEQGRQLGRWRLLPE